MAEPFSILTLITALAPLAKSGFSKLLQSETVQNMGGSAIGSSVEEVSGNFAAAAYNKLINNLPEILESPENHDLLRALRRSYLNATLVMCFARLQNINPSKFNAKNLISQVVSHNEDSGKIGELLKDFLKNRLLSSDEEANKEIKWIFRAIEYLNAQIAGVENWKSTETTIEAAEKAELLLKPENANAQIKDIETKFRAELIAELASTAYFQTFDTQESVGDDRYDRCLPTKLLNNINDGWFLLEDDGTNLKLSAKKIDYKWFDVMSVFFAEEIKTNARVSNIFNAKVLSDLKYQNGAPSNFTSQIFAEKLAESNKIILECLVDIEKEVSHLGEFKDEVRRNIKQILPLLVTVSDSAEIVKKLPELIKELNVLVTVTRDYARQAAENTIKLDEKFDLALKILEKNNQTPFQSSSSHKLFPASFIPDLSYFVGREDVLESIETTLAVTGKACLHDYHGIGKTFVCYKYAQKHVNDYEQIFFVSASAENYLNSLAKHAERVIGGSFPEDMEITLKVEAFRDYLSENKNWLVIYDNVDDPLEIFPYIPQNADGHCLFTSNFDSVKELATEVKIPKLDEYNSKLLLFRRSKRDVNAKVEFSDTTEEESFNNIIKEFDGLPLALRVAGAFIAKTKSFTQYWQKYQETPETILDKEDPFDSHNQKSVGKAITLSFNKISNSDNLEKLEQDKAKASKLILSTACFLYSSQIPEKLVRGILAYSKKGLAHLAENEDLWLDLREKLGEYDLLKFNELEKSFETHRTIQKVIKTKLDTFEKDWHLLLLISLLNHLLPEPNDENVVSPEFTIYLPHINSVINEKADSLWNYKPADNAVLYNLLLRTGGGLMNSARYSEAINYFRWCNDYDEMMFGENSFNTVESLYNLASAYICIYDYGEAEPLLNRAVEIINKSEWKNHTIVGIAFHRFAKLQEGKKNYEIAEEYYLKSLEILENLFSEYDAKVATVCADLASLYDDKGNLELSEKYLEKSLRIRKQLFGENSLTVGDCYWTAAKIYTNNKDDKEVLEYYYKAQKIYAQNFPPNHNRLNDLNREIALLEELMEMEELLKEMKNE